MVEQVEQGEQGGSKIGRSSSFRGLNMHSNFDNSGCEMHLHNSDRWIVDLG